MRKSKLGKIFLTLLTVILALVISVFGAACDLNDLFNFGNGDEQTENQPPKEEEPPKEDPPEENPPELVLGEDATTVRKELPEEGTNPVAVAPLDNIGYMATVLDNQPYYHVYSDNLLEAAGQVQDTQSWKDYKSARESGEEHSVMIESELSYSPLVRNSTQYCFIGSEKAIVRKGSGPASKDSTPFVIGWSDDADELKVYEKAAYKHRYGEFSTEISAFVINEDTLENADDVVENDNGTYSQTYHLNEYAAWWYRYAMMNKSMGGMNSFPEFEKIEITFTFNGKWEILACYGKVVSLIALGGITVQGESETTTAFDYTEEGFDGEHFAYYDYFKQYKDSASYDDGLVEGDESEIADSKLSIHFLELGNKDTGDSVLIKCGNTEVLIDAGSQQSSSATLKPYINKYCTDGTLEYVITTHADQDHIAAFVGKKSGSTYDGILYSYNIGTLIRFDISGKSETTGSGNRSLYGNYLDAVSYAQSRGTQVFTASQCYDQTGGAQRQYYLDEEETVSINILYNYYYYNKSSDENNHSVVTLLTEELDGVRHNYLFTGDLEEDGERRMVDYYKSVPADHATGYNVLPEVDLYKAGHHGSKTSSTEKLLEVIKPKYVVVCCCCGSTQYTTTNADTFPTQDMINHVGKYTDKIFVTTLATGLSPKNENGDYTSRTFGGYKSMNGNIVFYSTGKGLRLYCSNDFTILKDTEWFSENRTWPEDGV